MVSIENQRRLFLLTSVRAAAWYGVFYLGTARSAWAKLSRFTVRQWVEQLADLASDVRAGGLSGEEWQQAIERLHARITVEELIRALDIDQIVRRISHPKEKIGAVEDVRLPLREKRTTHFGHKLFVYRRGACTPPHAHNHLVSAHLVLKGQIRARTFDRLQDLEGSILIQPTGDQNLGPGHTVTMSDARNNVHWFEGLTDDSVSFDVPVAGITPEKKYRHPAEGMNQIFIDPTVVPQKDGNIVAPIIPFRQSVQKFG